MNQKEAAIQAKCFKWYNNKYCLKHHKPRCLIFAVPNEGQQRLVKQGVVSGVSDLIVFHIIKPKLSTFNLIHILLCFRILFIEMKDHKGVQSDAQKMFEQRVIKFPFCSYHLIRSLNEFQNLFIDTASNIG